MAQLPQTFPAPESPPDLLIIAGEHSGDQHAAHLVEEVRAKNPSLSVCALGGPSLEKAGAQILFDMMDLAVVGFVEVLKHYSAFKTVFKNTIDWIKTYRPKAICFVDFPGFNLRLAEALQKEGLSVKGGGEIPLYFYIAPQVWAWKPRRRFKMAKTLDALGVIFPFECKTFADTSLPTTFVGHPFVSSTHEGALTYDPNGPILLLPGSRKQAVGRIFPIMLAAFKGLLESDQEEQAVAIYPNEAVRSILEEALEAFPMLKTRVQLVSNEATVAGKAVLTSSGTMSLACALAGIPGAIVYRANPFTYLMGRMLVNINYLGIANILLDREVVPEFIQHEATPELLLAELSRCLHLSGARDDAQAVAEELKTLLSPGGDSPTPGAWLMQDRS